MNSEKSINSTISIKALSSHELILRTKDLIKKERVLLNQVLEHLEEIERRRLYLEKGFSSLFEYCVKDLGYSESAAQRRISSMRLSKELPEVKEKLKEGKLNLTTISLAQSFFRKEKAEKRQTYTSYEKSKLLEKLEVKSKKEVEKILIEISPNSTLPKEKERVLTTDLFEIKMQLNQSQMNKLNRLKELRPDLQKTSNALEWLLDKALKQVDPLYEKGKSASQTTSKVKGQIKMDCESFGKDLQMSKPQVNDPGVKDFRTRDLNQAEKPKRKYIKKSIKKQIWMKATGRCEYTDLKSGRRCLATSNLQIDHIHPLGLGGIDEPENLRLLCQQHNLFEAIKVYGSKKMSEFIDKSNTL